MPKPATTIIAVMVVLPLVSIWITLALRIAADMDERGKNGSLYLLLSLFAPPLGIALRHRQTKARQ
jgi:hypothetical protein